MKSPGAFKQDRLRFYNAAYGTDSPGFLKKLFILLSNTSLHAVALYRFGKASTILFNKSRLTGCIPVMVYLIFNHFFKIIHHVDIGRRSDIGPGLLIMHYHSIIIGPAKIGSNLTIHHNLTIGQRVAGLDNSIPEIGSNVWIGPQCVITGGIRIGDGATISAGTILSKNIPDYCLVAGNPGRIIMHNYDNSIMAAKKNVRPV